MEEDLEEVYDKNEPVIRVTVIKVEGEYALVEEVSTLKRVAVPVEAIEELLHGQAVPLNVFQEGIAFGVAWETLAYPTITPEMIAFELRRHGLQTAQEVRKQPAQASAALRAAYVPVLSTIIDLSKKLGG